MDGQVELLLSAIGVGNNVFRCAVPGGDAWYIRASNAFPLFRFPSWCNSWRRLTPSNLARLIG